MVVGTFTDQSNDFACLSNNFVVLQPLHQEREEEGDDGCQVDHVHRLLDEARLEQGRNRSKGRSTLLGQISSLSMYSPVKKITTKLSIISMTNTTLEKRLY